MLQRITALAFTGLLVGCAPDPGAQCLQSFAHDLKDPDSGKVIKFDDGMLTYTATNSYGGRTQGKALCTKAGDTWARNLAKERLLIAEATEKRLLEYNDCRKNGGSKDDCAQGAIVIKYSSSSVDALLEETRRMMGFSGI
jgi:hypothetical protein